MTDSWNETLPQSAWSNFKEISTSDDWFKVYEIAANLFVFYEPRHYEQTLVNLIIGRERAALIDTGCGAPRGAMRYYPNGSIRKEGIAVP